jgi:RNA polymerase sigma-70 factor (ECF subfamily)
MSGGSAANLTDLGQDGLARLRQRDATTLHAIVEELARPLYRAARGMGFDRTDAEDIVQDVFATFMSTLDRFEGRSRVSTWIFGILHHKAQERRREFARDDAQDPIDEVFEAQFDGTGGWTAPPVNLERQMASTEIAAAIGCCLEQLPAGLREVFVLREMQGQDTTEVCKILGRTVTHVGVQLHRARARLRQCLETKGWKGSQ